VQTIKKLYTAFPRLTTANTISRLRVGHKKRGRPKGRPLFGLVRQAWRAAPMIGAG
jgi:hypothetical protein